LVVDVNEQSLEVGLEISVLVGKPKDFAFNVISVAFVVLGSPGTSHSYTLL